MASLIRCIEPLESCRWASPLRMSSRSWTPSTPFTLVFTLMSNLRDALRSSSMPPSESMQRQLGGVRLAVMRGNVEKVELLAKVVTVNVASPSFVGLSFSMTGTQPASQMLSCLKCSTLIDTKCARGTAVRYGIKVVRSHS